MKEKKEKKNNEEIKLIGWIILGSLIVLGLFHIFTEKSRAQTSTDDPTQNIDQEVRMIDGVQEVTLSWGKFNYAPEVISVKKDIPLRIKADLKRLQGCYRSLEIPAFGISKAFSQQNDVLEFTPTKTGTFKFSCAMGMGSGILQVT